MDTTAASKRETLSRTATNQDYPFDLLEFERHCVIWTFDTKHDHHWIGCCRNKPQTRPEHMSILIHDNARLHSDVPILQSLLDLEWDVLLAPSDYNPMRLGLSIWRRGCPSKRSEHLAAEWFRNDIRILLKRWYGIDISMLNKGPIRKKIRNFRSNRITWSSVKCFLKRSLEIFIII